jgi:hypothetical protein
VKKPLISCFFLKSTCLHYEEAINKSNKHLFAYGQETSIKVVSMYFFPLGEEAKEILLLL